jgi:hypothetical protein
MIDLIPFQPEHLDRIQEQEATAHLRPLLTPEMLRTLATLPHSYTATVGGRVVACGGLVEYWPGRAEAWAVLDATSRRDFLALHNAARRILDAGLFRRVEAVVDAGFGAGHRWLRALGFSMEAPRMRRYGADGRDYSLYARLG